MFSVLEPCTECWGKVELRDALPEISAYDDVTYVPYQRNAAWGIFGQDGAAADGSVDLHGPDATTPDQLLSWRGTADHLAPEPAYIYAGVLNPHYGHFLINSLSRLWPLAGGEMPAAKLLFHGDGNPAEWFNLPFMRDIFRSCAISSKRLC